MLITSLLSPQALRASLRSRSKEGIIEELVASLALEEKAVKREKVICSLLEREKLGSTVIGEGVAIPHGKVKGIKELICAFGRSSKGVSFGGQGEKPVHLFFLLVGPLTKAGDHLKALTKIVKMMKDEAFKEQLLSAGNEEEIYHLIREKDKEELS